MNSTPHPRRPCEDMPRRPMGPGRMEKADTFWKKLRRWLLVWEMMCGTYMLEPTERLIIQGSFFFVLAVLLVAAMTYLPGHMIMMKHFFEGVYGT